MSEAIAEHCGQKIRLSDFGTQLVGYCPVCSCQILVMRHDHWDTSCSPLTARYTEDEGLVLIEPGGGEIYLAGRPRQAEQ